MSNFVKAAGGECRPVDATRWGRRALRASALAGLVSMSPLAAHADIPIPASVGGTVGPVLGNWHGVPIHAALLSDGRVMTYGTHGPGTGMMIQGSLINWDATTQKGKAVFEVWDPRQGTGPAAHFIFEQSSTPWDVFCSAQIMTSYESLLIVGGDRTDSDGSRSNSNNGVSLVLNDNLYPMSAQRQLQVPRWYPNVVTLPNAEILVLGGRKQVAKNDPGVYSLDAVVPEVIRPNPGGWTRRVLGHLPPDLQYEAFNNLQQDISVSKNWAYPRAWVAPQDGKVFVLAAQGQAYHLGTLTDHDMTRANLVDGSGRSINVVPSGHQYLPSVMYDVGKIFSLRRSKTAVVVDINDPAKIVVRSVPGVDEDRYNGFATVMADGKVLLSGGGHRVNPAPSSDSEDINDATTTKEVTPVYRLRIWNPSGTGALGSPIWTEAPLINTPRLYHSIAMLMPDATVLIGGGGAPGPYTNRNAEIYYPPYLYNAQNGLATRPKLNPNVGGNEIFWGQSFKLDADMKIDRVTLVRASSVTHTVAFDGRFMNLPFATRPEDVGNTITVSAPANANLAPPGMYMLFAFSKGVPSLARMVWIFAPSTTSQAKKPSR